MTGVIRKIEIQGRDHKERMAGAIRAIEELEAGESIEIHSATIVSIHREQSGRLTSSWTTESGHTETTLSAASILSEYASQGNTSWIYKGNGSELRYWQSLSGEWHKQEEKPVLIYEAGVDYDRAFWEVFQNHND